MKMDLFEENLPTREVYCDDANIWLLKKRFDIMITSLPDMEEVGATLEKWQEWIKSTCNNIVNSANNDSIIFFYQTDRKYSGRIIDKKTMISQVFLDSGYNNILSKIVLRREPNKMDLFRPTYTNLFGFSKTITSGGTTPDVIYAGKMIYNNAMGFNAVETCINFLKAKKITGTILDPFCGQGSVLKIANQLGYDAIGVDILQEQVNKAINL
jgi:2-polyprenyl-3-methyl-5-hydroxy-6-metoxy-1,4-benzoquinol methylase